MVSSRLYAAYKQHGANLLDDYQTSGEYSSLNKDTEDLPTVLVGDFSRADVQANLMWRMAEGGELQLAWGRSYLGALAMLIPKSVWPERPPTAIAWITDAEYGRGVFSTGIMRSTRVYGIAGEAALNFGIAGIPLSLALLGWAGAIDSQFCTRTGSLRRPVADPTVPGEPDLFDGAR